MSWNYRVIYHPPSKYKISKTEFDREEYLAIHEVYYDDKDNPELVTEDVIIAGDEGKESLLSLKWMLEHMLEALNEPILNMELQEEKEKQNEFSKSTETEEQVCPKDCETSNGHTNQQ